MIATGTPFLDRGGFFARVNAQRSYAAAFTVDGPIPQDMYLGADDPSVSLRTAPRPGHDGEQLLLVGGFGHEVGRVESEQAHVDNAYDEGLSKAEASKRIDALKEKLGL